MKSFAIENANVRILVREGAGDTIAILCGWGVSNRWLLSRNGSMVTLETLRSGRRADILRLAARHGASNLRVFGSVAQGESKEASDLDLLVEREPGRSLMDHARLVLDLQELLGARVHVGTEQSLYWCARERILHEATPL